MSNDYEVATNNGSRGIGIASVLTIVFIVLKLVGVINWSWIWVLAPLWISFSAAVFLILLVMIVALIIAALSR